MYICLLDLGRFMFVHVCQCVSIDVHVCMLCVSCRCMHVYVWCVQWCMFACMSIIFVLNVWLYMYDTVCVFSRSGKLGPRSSRAIGSMTQTVTQTRKWIWRSLPFACAKFTMILPREDCSSTRLASLQLFEHSTAETAWERKTGSSWSLILTRSYLNVLKNM